MDNVESGTFFGDEEYALTVCEAVRDDVRDRLRFSRTGGPCSTKSCPAAAAITAASCEESALRGQNTSLGWNGSSSPAGRMSSGGFGYCDPPSSIKCFTMRFTARSSRRSVRSFHRRNFVKENCPIQISLLVPARQIADGIAEQLEHALDVHALVIFREWIETGNLFFGSADEAFPSASRSGEFLRRFGGEEAFKN